MWVDGRLPHHVWSRYYREHYPGINTTTNKTHIFPSQSLETWQCPDIPPVASNCVTNPTPDIAGLRAVLPRLLKLPAHLTTAAQRAAWGKQLSPLPELPVATFGKQCVAHSFRQTLS